MQYYTGLVISLKQIKFMISVAGVVLKKIATMVKNRYTFAVFGILCIAIFLRMFGGTATYYWASDVARDYLVASHILHYKDFPTVGHLAAGFGEPFYYPPFVYYVLSILQVFFPSPELLIGFFITFHVIGIGVAIYSAYLCFGWEIALFSGLFMAFSAKMIDMSRYMNVTPALPLVYCALLLSMVYTNMLHCTLCTIQHVSA